MRKTLTFAALALSISPLALAHGPAQFAQSAQQEVVITSEDLGNGVHMLTGQGGNIGLLVGEDGVFVIDSQFARIAPKNLARSMRSLALRLSFSSTRTGTAIIRAAMEISAQPSSHMKIPANA